jgi:hypothetical protein
MRYFGDRSGGGLEPAGRGPFGVLHKGIIGRPREMAGVIGDKLGASEHEHVEHRAIVVARGLEGGDVRLANHVALADDLCGQLAQGVFGLPKPGTTDARAALLAARELLGLVQTGTLSSLAKASTRYELALASTVVQCRPPRDGGRAASRDRA